MMQSTIPRYGTHTGVPIPDLSSSAQSSLSGSNPQAKLRTHPSGNNLRMSVFQGSPQQQTPRPAHVVPSGFHPGMNCWGTPPNDLSKAYARQNSITVGLPSVDGVVRVPLYPNVEFKDSPFYEVLDVIQPPTLIIPHDVNFQTGKRPYERTYDFRIDANQAETITYHSTSVGGNRREFRVQALMRFGKVESSMLHAVAAIQPALDAFDDNMPIHLVVQVNGRNVALPPFLPTSRPNMDGRRNARPISITPQMRICPNSSNLVKLSWSHEYTSFTYYFFAIYLVKKLSIKELCSCLRTNCYRPATVVRKQIVDKLASSGISVDEDGQDEEDDDIQIQNTLPVQLLCPLSKCRINLPVRGQKCQHIQCYDANTYLIINERKPAWKCPVCDLLAPFDELFVDGFLMDILASKESQDVEEIVFNEDGSWTTVKSSVGCAGSSVDSPPVSSSNGHAPLAEASSIYPKANPSAAAAVGSDVLIDLTASDDDDVPGPPVKRLAVGTSSVHSRQCSSSLTPASSSPYRLPPPSHDSLSAHFSQKQHRQVLCCNNAMRYAHSNSFTSMTTPTSSAAFLVDAKPDPRRVFSASYAPISAPRPCSHSATPSPRTPQSLGHASTAVAKSSLSLPSIGPSVTSAIVPNHHITAPLNLAARDLVAKMAASICPQMSQQQMLEAYISTMKMSEYNHYLPNATTTSAPPLPPKAAHQNNSISSPPSSNRSSTSVLPTPAHSNFPTVSLPPQPWRVQANSALPTVPNAISSSTSISTVGNSTSPPFFSSGGGGRTTCPSTFLELWSAAASVHPLARHSLGHFYRVPPSPPHAHSNNSSPPPRQGDPRHPDSGFFGLSNSSGWSTSNQ